MTHVQAAGHIGRWNNDAVSIVDIGIFWAFFACSKITFAFPALVDTLFYLARLVLFIEGLAHACVNTRESIQCAIIRDD